MTLSKCYLIRNKVCSYYGDKGRTVVIDCSTHTKAYETMKYIIENQLNYSECIELKNTFK